MPVVGVTPVADVLAGIVEGAYASEWYFCKSSRMV
jgi:hypothetical protein